MWWRHISPNWTKRAQFLRFRPGASHTGSVGPQSTGGAVMLPPLGQPFQSQQHPATQPIRRPRPNCAWSLPAHQFVGLCRPDSVALARGHIPLFNSPETLWNSGGRVAFEDWVRQYRQALHLSLVAARLPRRPGLSTWAAQPFQGASNTAADNAAKWRCPRGTYVRCFFHPSQRRDPWLMVEASTP